MAPFGRRKKRPRPSKDQRAPLVFLKDLIEAGMITPIVDETFPLRRVTEAMRCLQEGRARGRIVITVYGTDRPT